MQTLSVWPPAYKVKRHRRAKHVKLRASNQGLEITIPYRFNVKYLRNILEENKSWITKQLSQLPIVSEETLPATLSLQALEQTWQVHYREMNTTRLSLRQSAEQVLILEGNVSNAELCKTKLRTWLKYCSKNYLEAHLNFLSEKTQLPFAKVSIRDQRTLWGSCTIHAAISLNYKLIFLPERLVTHILLHELCHTKFLNHSSKFWRLVSFYDSNWQQHKQELKHAEHYVPAWV